MPDNSAILKFIDRWKPSGGAERSNYQLFLSELCDLLAVPRPQPAQPDNDKNTYVFDRAVASPQPDGSAVTNYIDLYKANCFVLETKQGVEAEQLKRHSLLPTDKAMKKGHGLRGSRAWDDALLRAKAQAENYVKLLRADNPPFVIVVDVGHSIESVVLPHMIL